MSIYAFGVGLIAGDGKDVDWNITSFGLNENGCIRIVRECSGRVEGIQITTEAAQEIGLINLDALNKIIP
jgi:hypothetical protein